MTSYLRARWVSLVATGAILGTMVGCRPAEEQPPLQPPPPTPGIAQAPPPSKTTPASVTVSPQQEPILPVGPDDVDDQGAVSDARRPAAIPTGAKLVPIEIELPAPAFRGTPKPSEEPNVEEPLGEPRAPFLAPEGTVNLAEGKPVAASDAVPVAGELDYVTDGDKEVSDFGFLELHPGSHWVQVDLEMKATVYAVLLWHNHAEARVYRDVIVQVSDDPDFLDPQTVFNNDYDNSSGLGIGGQKGYVETAEGKLIDCKGVEGRYLRLYSKGNHLDSKNHYTEVEVYGRPAA